MVDHPILPPSSHLIEGARVSRKLTMRFLPSPSTVCTTQFLFEAWERGGSASSKPLRTPRQPFRLGRGGLPEIDESENRSREVKNAGRLTLRSARGRRFEAHTLFAIDCSWANETSKLTAHYEFKRRNNRSRPDACPSCSSPSRCFTASRPFIEGIFPPPPPPIAPLNSGIWNEERNEQGSLLAFRVSRSRWILRRWTGRGSQGTGGFSNVECYYKWEPSWYKSRHENC